MKSLLIKASFFESSVPYRGPFKDFEHPTPCGGFWERKKNPPQAWKAPFVGYDSSHYMAVSTLFPTGSSNHWFSSVRNIPYPRARYVMLFGTQQCIQIASHILPNLIDKPLMRISDISHCSNLQRYDFSREFHPSTKQYFFCHIMLHLLHNFPKYAYHIQYISSNTL